jgi:toxin YoeB
MFLVSLSKNALADLNWYSNKNPHILKKIFKLLTEIQRNPTEGEGKVERLKFDLAGKYSRRIDQKNRIVYAIIEDQIIIYSCKDHYDDH